MRKLSKKGIIYLSLLLLFIIIVILGIVFIFKHTSKNYSPEELTNQFFIKYQKEKEEVVSKIQWEFDDELSDTQLQRYKQLMKKQYRNLKYSIINSDNGDNDCNVEVHLTVIDLKSAYDKANSYVESHRESFEDEKGDLDINKIIDYKLEQLESAKEIIDYSLKINFYKDSSDHWLMSQLSLSDLQKIDGVF